MPKMLLSLKNIYRLLTADDFPMYSVSTISLRNRRGLTLASFWQNILLPEFRMGTCGQMIWRSTGKRNRYLSHVCNRTVELPFADEYAEEIAEAATPSALLSQTLRFREFLEKREYRADVLPARLAQFIRLTAGEDPAVTPAIREHLESLLAVRPALARAGKNGEAFAAACVLTVLSLYAAAGGAMGLAPMEALRDPKSLPEALWKGVRQPEDKAAKTVLSRHVSLLEDDILPAARFFGREGELYDLREIVRSQRKCLIRGIGGSGKTELLRQLIRVTKEENLADDLAIIPYEGSLADSAARAFPEAGGSTAEERFHAILFDWKRRIEAGQRLAVFVDNVTHTAEEDPAFVSLRDLSCAVVATGRISDLDGFETFQITAVSASTGALIFRDNCARPVPRADQSAVQKILTEHPTLCHALTLRLMGRAFGADESPAAQLAAWLSSDNGAERKTDTGRLRRMYDSLYSYASVPAEGREILRLFAMLPYDGLTAEEGERFFPSVFTPEARGMLAALVAGGWLDHQGDTYSMHPLVAECMRRRVRTEEKLGPLLTDLTAQFPAGIDTSVIVDANRETSRITRLYIALAEWVTGPVSRDLYVAYAKAVGGQLVSYDRQKEILAVAGKLYDRCRDRDGLTDLYRLVLPFSWGSGDPEAVKAVWEQRETYAAAWPTVWHRFLLSASMGVLKHGRTELAGQMLESLLAGPDLTDDVRMLGLDCLSWKCQIATDFTGAMRYSEEAEKLASSRPDDRSAARFAVFIHAGSLALMFGRKEKTAEALQRLKSEGLPDDPVCRMEYEDLASSYGLYFGSPSEAYLHYKKLADLYRVYHGSDRTYSTYQSQMGICCQRMGRYEEAVRLYGEALDHARRTDNTGDVQIFANNLAACLADMKEGERGLPYAQESVAIAREHGGIALGESLRTLSRIRRLLGEEASEKEALSEACTLLEANYGAEHPRVQEMKARLEELS